MKDERLVTFVYEFQSGIYFVFHPVSLILYPNSVLNPLSKRHSESKMDEKKDFLKKDTRTPSYATLKNNEEGVSK